MVRVSTNELLQELSECFLISTDTTGEYQVVLSQGSSEVWRRHRVYFLRVNTHTGNVHTTQTVLQIWVTSVYASIVVIVLDLCFCIVCTVHVNREVKARADQVIHCLGWVWCSQWERPVGLFHNTRLNIRDRLFRVSIIRVKCDVNFLTTNSVTHATYCVSHQQSRTHGCNHLRTRQQGFTHTVRVEVESHVGYEFSRNENQLGTFLFPATEQHNPLDLFRQTDLQFLIILTITQTVMQFVNHDGTVGTLNFIRFVITLA